VRASEEASKQFYDWIWPHRDVVLRTARFLMRDLFEADDLAQETLLKAFRSLDRFTPGTDARAWLLSILRNARIDRLRSSAMRHAEASLDDAGIDPAADAATPVAIDPGDARALLEQFGDEQIVAALQALPELICWTLLLVDVEGMDHAEAAKVLDVPVGTVKSRAHRGRSMLRKSLWEKVGVDRRLSESS
jgi:RNA polymerase sigma-70 factor, ECF subfamily